MKILCATTARSASSSPRARPSISSWGRDGVRARRGAGDHPLPRGHEDQAVLRLLAQGVRLCSAVEARTCRRRRRNRRRVARSAKRASHCCFGIRRPRTFFREELAAPRARVSRVAKDNRPEPTPDFFAGVDGDHGCSTVGVLQKMMAATNSNRFDPRAAQRSNHSFPWIAGSRVTPGCEMRWTPMKSSDSVGSPSTSRHKPDRLPDPLVELVQRSRLCVTTGKRRDGSDVQAILVAFDQDIELACHGRDSTPSPSSPLQPLRTPS